MMRRSFLACAAVPVWAQTKLPSFDAASVRMVNELLPGGFRHEITPGGLTMRAVSMGYCLRLAFGLTAQRPWELIGPAWIEPPTSALYDVVGKTASPASPEDIRLMLRSLLMERFGLVTHREQKVLPAYILAVAKPSSALRPSSSSAPGRIRYESTPFFLVGEHVSMPELALNLGPPTTSRPVIDRTGLSGRFDFRMNLDEHILDPATGAQRLDARGAIDTEGAMLRGLPEQLGLALRKGSGEFPVLIVDHVDKRPTEN
jgi:uncharacterized protein (TIGR03435 family)